MARSRLLRLPLAEPEHAPLLTRRLVLRTPTLSDHREWAALRESSQAFLRPFEPEWTARELSRTTYRQRLRSQAGLAAAGRALPWFLFERERGRMVGGITVSNIRRGVAQAGTVGYWMGAEHAGHGYMREALRAVMACAFEEHDLHRLEAATLPDNERSIRVLERCGFRREGVARSYLRIAGAWRDHLLYATVNPSPTAGH